MSHRSCIIYSIMFITFATQNTHALFSFKKIGSAFRSKSPQEIIEKEYPISTQEKIVIDNLLGDITVKTEWNQKSTALKATIRNQKQDQDSVHIIDDISNPKEFALRTITDNEKNKAQVDYELIVPANIKLHLSTNKGTIHVHDAHGITMATTDDGSIYFDNVHNKASATTRKSGAIYCKDCSGPLYATARRGNITMTDVRNTVIAKTDSGRISIACKELAQDSRIDLSSKWGNIMVALPEDLHANIKAQTQRGTCICDHYVTLRPQTTKLNNAAWAQFRRTIDGTIGGGTIPVQISSVSSNIKILASKVS